MKNYQKLILFVTLLIFVIVIGKIMITLAQQSNSDDISLKPNSPQNLESEVIYDEYSNNFLVALSWQSPGFAEWENELGNIYPVDDVGYVIYRQQLEPEKTNIERILVLLPEFFIDGFNSGGDFVDQIESMGSIVQKYKYYIEAWDMSIGETDDESNHVSNQISTEVELKIEKDECVEPE